MANRVNTVQKLLEVLRFQSREIYTIYFFAIFSGIVQLSVPVGVQSIISFVMGGSMSTSLVVLIVFVIAGVFATGMLQVAQMKIIERIQQLLFVRYSLIYAESIPKLSLSETQGYYLPELSNKFFDIISLQKGISKILLDLPAASIQILFGLILLSFYHPVFIFFGLLLLTILFVILRQTGNRGLQTSLAKSDYKYKVASFLQELSRFSATYKFAKDDSMHIKMTDSYLSGYLAAATEHFKILLLQYRTLIGFKVTIIGAMLIVGSYLLVEQQLNIGQFIAAEMVIMMVIESVEKLIVNLDKIYDVLTSVEKINKLPDLPKEHSGSMKFEKADGGVEIEASQLTICVGDKTVLENAAFKIAPGEKVVLTGNQGSGKSTLLKVIGGIYDAYSGSLNLNGIPMGNFDASTVREHVGVVLTSQSIFRGTIMENILMGGTNVNMQKLVMLSELVGLGDFIKSKKEGFDFQLQPTGFHLPGNTVRKILLLRALIHEPELLLLEEPWVGMEDRYVLQIKQYLLQIPRTTVIVVTTDKDYAEKCDQVLVIENQNVKKVR